MTEVNLDSIQTAARRIAPYAHRTPVLTSNFFNDLLGTNLYFKCENFQKAGAFKFRGACNAILSLTEDQTRLGVTTHSSGNHGQAVALAAKLHGIEAAVIMPSNAPPVKRAAIESYGADVIVCAPNEAARVAAAQEVVERRGATLIHPYNDNRIIAGQATAALELIEDEGPFDVLVAPLGGGGLLSGTALSAAALTPKTEVWGAEPAGADDALRSLSSGTIIPSINPHTIADGLLTSLGDRTFAIIRQHAAGIATVSDTAIVQAMRCVWERMKIIIEPSSAVAVAAVMQKAIATAGKRVGIILSGGNVNMMKIPWLG